jgi:creatinine amidohydrolase
MRPYILAEANWKTIRDRKTEVAVLPWGATEAHNYHLPYSTDTVMVEKIAAEAACIAWEKGTGVIVLPAVPFGVNTGQLDIFLDMNMNPSTQFALLGDIADNLCRNGISRLLILNGHGGNDFRQMVRELGAKFPGMFICMANWFKIPGQNSIFENEGDHADEMETSVMQFIAPHMVLPLNEAGKGVAKKFRIAAFSEKWAWAERRWSKVTEDTGIGDPSLSTPEKGRRYFEKVTQTLAELINDLAAADINDMYE